MTKRFYGEGIQCLSFVTLDPSLVAEWFLRAGAVYQAAPAPALSDRPGSSITFKSDSSFPAERCANHVCQTYVLTNK